MPEHSIPAFFLKDSLIRFRGNRLSFTFGPEMRAVLFFISLFALLIRADYSASATPVRSTESQRLTQHKQIKPADTDTYWAIGEDDLDSTEEIPASPIKDKAPAKFTSVSLFRDRGFLIQHLLALHDRSTHIPTSFCGYSAPIYLTHRVLRI